MQFTNIKLSHTFIHDPFYILIQSDISLSRKGSNNEPKKMHCAEIIDFPRHTWCVCVLNGHKLLLLLCSMLREEIVHFPSCCRLILSHCSSLLDFPFISLILYATCLVHCWKNQSMRNRRSRAIYR